MHIPPNISRKEDPTLVAYETRETLVEKRKESLKQDHFVTTTSHGLDWASQNRKSMIVTASLLLAVILVAVLAVVIANSRSSSADTAFGAAMAVYQSPISTPGQPDLPGVKTYPNVAARAHDANTAFRQTADQYGSTQAGRNARYFEGLTYIEEGQPALAESTLKDLSTSWHSNIASLAKYALADIYRQTNRESQAIDLYNQLIAKPTDSVPAFQAQIALAELYSAQGRSDQARKLYAQVKDKDPKGAAGTIASQKLNPSAAPAAPQM